MSLYNKFIYQPPKPPVITKTALSYSPGPKPPNNFGIISILCVCGIMYEIENHYNKKKAITSYRNSILYHIIK